MPASEITCPVCLETLKVGKPVAAGATVRCPMCKGAFTVPANGGDSVPVPTVKTPPKPSTTSKLGAPRQSVKPAPKSAAKPAPKRPPQKTVPDNAFADLDTNGTGGNGAAAGRGSEPNKPPRKRGGGALKVVLLVLVILGGLGLLGCGGVVVLGIVLFNQYANTTNPFAQLANTDTFRTTEPATDKGATKAANTPKDTGKKEEPPRSGPAHPAGGDPGQAAREQLDEQAATLVKKATVQVRIPGPDGKEIIRTGFFAGEQGLILTSAQGLRGAGGGLRPPPLDVIVDAGEKDERPITAFQIGAAPEFGLVLLRAQKRGDTPLMVPPPLSLQASKASPNPFRAQR